VILVAGIPDERPMALVTEALDEIGANYRVLDQRRVATAKLQLEIADAPAGGAVGGTLTLEDETVPLPEISGMFLRLMDDRVLPGVAELPPDAPERARSRRFHELLLRFADIAPGRVLNRPADTASNHSKPYQAQLIRAAGFDIPETLITNDPSAAREFMERAWSSGGDVIYKSISGVRSIVRRAEQQDLARLDQIRWCPTQFQRHVAGTDLRVHVVGDTALAASISSAATDYRYAARETGVGPDIGACELGPRVERLCIRLAEKLRLPLAGIDLRRTPEGRYVCFEVNPSPAFSYYEGHAGLPIANRIARYLAGEVTH
jgi:glutathione synthase/RimK-type ligase-like ATP-grasp enzyme